MPLWVSLLLVLSHVFLFVVGVVCYHQVRLLSVRPLSLSRQSDAQDRKLKELATALAKKEVKAEAYNYFNRFDKPVEVFEDAPIPNVNKLKESGFAPAK